jgi:hypothetical protein
MTFVRQRRGLTQLFRRACKNDDRPGHVDSVIMN